MISSAKVLWGEGLFLRPQHFQRQDAYHEWRLAQVGRVLNPYAWGVRSVKVDTEALAIGQLRLLDVQALVETLAERCAEIILGEFNVSHVRLKLSKPGAVRGARAVGVIIERSRT